MGSLGHFQRGEDLGGLMGTLSERIAPPRAHGDTFREESTSEVRCPPQHTACGHT